MIESLEWCRVHGEALDSWTSMTSLLESVQVYIVRRCEEYVLEYLVGRWYIWMWYGEEEKRKCKKRPYYIVDDTRLRYEMHLTLQYKSGRIMNK